MQWPQTLLKQSASDQNTLQPYHLSAFQSPYVFKSEGKKPFIMCSESIAKMLDGYNLLNLGKTPEQIASNLYDKLLEGENKADIIIAVAMPDESGVNMGIMNRMRKSCG